MTQPALFPAPLARHRTAAERRAQQSAQQAIARALAHTRQPGNAATPAYNGPLTACPGCWRPHQQPPDTPCDTCATEEDHDA